MTSDLTCSSFSSVTQFWGTLCGYTMRKKTLHNKASSLKQSNLVATEAGQTKLLLLPFAMKHLSKETCQIKGSERHLDGRQACKQMKGDHRDSNASDLGGWNPQRSQQGSGLCGQISDGVCEPVECDTPAHIVTRAMPQKLVRLWSI